MLRIVSFDDFAGRQCPWFDPKAPVNNGYGCTHPAQSEVEIVPTGHSGRECLTLEGKCFSFSCPLGYEINPKSEPADADLLQQQGWIPSDFDDGDLLLLEELAIEPGMWVTL